MPIVTPTLNLPQPAIASTTSPRPAGPATPAAAPAAHDASLYESLKHGIASTVTDIEDAISHGAHAVADGVETAVSAVHTAAKGIVELPFAAVAKACDAAGALIDEL